MLEMKRRRIVRPEITIQKVLDGIIVTKPGKCVSDSSVPGTQNSK
jgi:hypothetical protein